MSAFMCSDEHISSMVNFLPEKERKGAGQALFSANEDSLVARYGDRITKGKFKYKKDIRVSPVQGLKNCDCFDYQACEVDNYRASCASALVSRIRSLIIADLPGYEEATWGI